MRAAQRPAGAASDAPSIAAPPQPDSSRLRPPRQSSGDDLLLHHDLPGVDDAPALLLLSAPAGYGKSAQLSACYHRHAAAGGRVGWLTLDREDADPDRLAEMLCHALAGTHLPPPVVTGTARTELSCLLEGGHLTIDDQPLRIFIDGFDRIAGTAAAGMLCDLIDRYQARVRWMVATRPVSLRDILHLRTRGVAKLVEGRALRLPPSTYAAVLGRPITPQEQDAIDAAVEGWPIALRALRLELDAGIDVRDALLRLGAPGSLVDDYIGAELLPSLSPATADFLCQASILGRFDAPTVDLLFGRTDSHLRLGALDLLSPLASPSPSGGWRLNPILAQHLEHRFDRRSDIDVADVRMTAFRLLADCGDYVGAIKNALKAGGAREAAHLIGNAGVLRLWTELGFEPMLAIVRMLPPALGTHQPSLRFCDALSLFDAGRTTSAIRLLDTIRADVLRDFRSDRETTNRFELEWIAIRAIIGLVREVVREEVLDQLPFSATAENGSLTDVLSFVHVLLWAVAHQQWGELDDADRMVSLAEQAAPPKSAAFNGYFFAIYRGWIAAARGDARRAMQAAACAAWAKRWSRRRTICRATLPAHRVRSNAGCHRSNTPRPGSTSSPPRSLRPPCSRCATKACRRRWPWSNGCRSSRATGNPRRWRAWSPPSNCRCSCADGP
jgi:ATP/maltotriose-dependent transcriptional regulator MalT